eukprot:76381_1
MARVGCLKLVLFCLVVSLPVFQCWLSLNHYTIATSDDVEIAKEKDRLPKGVVRAISKTDPPGIELARHHIISKDTLIFFWNAIINNDLFNEFKSVITKIAKDVANSNLHDIEDNKEKLWQLFIWNPCNLFLGPVGSQRSDDPTSDFEETSIYADISTKKYLDLKKVNTLILSLHTTPTLPEKQQTLKDALTIFKNYICKQITQYNSNNWKETDFHPTTGKQRYAFDKTKKGGAATEIESRWKGYIARKRYLKDIKDITKIQALARGRAQRKRYAKDIKDITKIQALARGRAQRKRYAKDIKDITTIQALARGRKQRKEFEKKLKQHKAAIIIQKHVRGHQQKKKYSDLKKTAIKLQSQYRGNKQRHNYQKLKDTAIQLQSKYRGKKERKNFQRLRNVATKVQAKHRGNKQRHNYQKLKDTAIQLQSKYRGKKERKNFQRLRNVATKVQAKHRGNKQRHDYQKLRNAAIKVQSKYRGRKQQREYQRLKKAATTIQSKYRGRH